MQSKNIEQDLSGDYLMLSDTLKYQLSLKKIDKNTYYYQFYNCFFYPDLEGFNVEFSGVFKKSGMNYKTVYTNSLGNGFILSLGKRDEIYVKKDDTENTVANTHPDDAVSELEKIGTASAIELLSDIDKRKYLKKIQPDNYMEPLNGRYVHFKKDIFKESFLYDLNTNPQIVKGNYKKLSNVSASGIFFV